MQLFKPEFTYETINPSGEAEHYELTVTTLCDKSNYCDVGYDIAEKLDQENHLMISVYLKQDSDTPETTAHTKVIHYPLVKKLPATAKGFSVEAIVKSATQGQVKKGKSKMKLSSRTDNDRSGEVSA